MTHRKVLLITLPESWDWWKKEESRDRKEVQILIKSALIPENCPGYKLKRCCHRYVYGHSALKCQVNFHATEISSDYCKSVGNPDTYAEVSTVINLLRYLVKDSTCNYFCSELLWWKMNKFSTPYHLSMLDSQTQVSFDNSIMLLFLFNNWPWFCKYFFKNSYVLLQNNKQPSTFPWGNTDLFSSQSLSPPNQPEVPTAQSEAAAPSRQSPLFSMALRLFLANPPLSSDDAPWHRATHHPSCKECTIQRQPGFSLIGNKHKC